MAGDVFDFNSIIVHKDGFPLPYLTNEAFMKELEDMELREDDIFVVTYPKSGTHWMQEIVQLILVDGHGGKLNNSHRRMRIELADVKSKSPEVIAAAGPTLRHMKDDPSPRVFTTHVPYRLLPKQFREKSCKLIYVYRHPKDVIVSFFHYLSRRHDINGVGTSFFSGLEARPEKFGRPQGSLTDTETTGCRDQDRGVREKPVSRPTSTSSLVGSVKKTHSSKHFSSFFDLITSGKFQYGSWLDHVMGYYKHKDDENVFPISYEKIKKDLRTVVANLSSFIGRQLDDAAINRVVDGASLESMKKAYKIDDIKNAKLGKDVLDANVYLYKGETGRWRENLTPEQNRRFDELFGKAMKECDWTIPYALDMEA